MDESWRVTMGSILLSNIRRRSVATGASPPPLSPEDFKDVFGGPPKTLLLRHHLQLYGDRSLFDDVFRPVDSSYFETASSVGGSRRRDVGVTSEGDSSVVDGFYDDIFGSRGGGSERRRRLRTGPSESNSSTTIRSLENPSSHVNSSRYCASKMKGLDLENHTFSSTSKLRQISIATMHNSLSKTPSLSCDNTTTTTATTARRADIYWQLKPSSASIHLRSPYNSKSDRKTDDNMNYSCNYDPNPSMWTINKMWRTENQPDVDFDDDSDDSVCSPISSSSSDSKVRIAYEKALRDLAREVVIEIDDDDDVWNFPRSYLVGASSHSLFLNRRKEETEGEAAVDEAIAWARENLRIRTESSSKESVC